MEIKVPANSTIHGFILEVKHDPGEGYASQVKLVKVSGISSYGVKKVDFQTIHELQNFVVPKVRNRSILRYQLMADTSPYNTFSFDFVRSYGGPRFEVCPCKVTLYKI